MLTPPDNLAPFHPLIARWFADQVGTPTAVQAAAWPAIAAGEHVLVTAPTGTGKTLTAFLWALNQLITGVYPAGQTSILYVSPLKALNTDIQRNLLAPLSALRERFTAHGVPFPTVRVFTRSGDTPANERRRMERTPPEILITTPESLNLLLSSKGGLKLLGTLQVVILDEIHAVLDSRRGVHLMSGVERLVRLSGEFQRIALSATVRPLELVAAFVGGYRRLESGDYAARLVRPIRADATKQYAVQVDFPDPECDEGRGQSRWPPIIRTCREHIARNRSTLLFTNNRRLAETITWKLNAGEEELLAYAHHGALARALRQDVERRLKAGRLKAIVATSTLEMGIDIGALDEVLLVGTPPTVAGAIQRAGRAGHQVGETTRTTLLPTHPQDLLAAAVVARAIPAGTIEAARAIRGPLDVLAQILVSMVATESWELDDLYAEVRRSFPYHDLSRTQFDLVIEMLAGRYAETRIPELTPRLSLDRLDQTVAARPGATQALYRSGGTIPDRGYFHLRHLESGGIIGELDEEYVWEARLGQPITFGTQSWRIERITHNDVFVTPAPGAGRATPFWKADEFDRGAHLATLLADFLEEASATLDDPAFLTRLQEEHGLTAEAAEVLRDYLVRQRAHCGGVLPHRRQLVIEHVASGPGGAPGTQTILHTHWGGTLNRPFALALAAAWEERFGGHLEIFPADHALCLLMTQPVPAEELLALVTGPRLEELLKHALAGSGYFGARFRECAGRALLLSRHSLHERMPLWVTRLRAQRLLGAVQGYGDFPIILEAWRTCLQDEFELDALRERLEELATGAIKWHEIATDTPSPFAQTMSWRQINEFMYADDTPAGQTNPGVRADLLREVVFSPSLRPAIDPAVIATFEEKRQRLAPGYAPQSARDLLDWTKERVLIPQPEWETLLQAVERDHGVSADALLQELPGKLTWLMPPAASAPLVVATEDLARVRGLWEAPADDEGYEGILGEWLRFYGPRAPHAIAATLGVPPEALTPLLDDLLDTGRAIQGALVVGGTGAEVCDAELFERLLRLTRAAAAPAVAPLPIDKLPLFLAVQQGLCPLGEGQEALPGRLDTLRGYPAPAELWEEALLPARVQAYDPAALDALVQQAGWHWIGGEGRRICWCPEDELGLLGETQPAEAFVDLLPDPFARYPLAALAARGGRMDELVSRLWDGAWTGTVSNDSVAALRQGIATGFKPPQVSVSSGSGRPSRTGFSRWSASVPLSGNWYRLPWPEPPFDRVEADDRARMRARLVLARYGVVCRELLAGELPLCQWPGLFRALRLMELAGEVLAGHFITGLSGLQFITPRALRTLQRPLPVAAIWWANALDPAACCGLSVDALRGRLPRRVATTTLVFRGADPVVIAERGGKTLTLAPSPDDPRLPDLLAPLRLQLERRVRPVLQIAVETINGLPAAQSPYLDALRAVFDVVPNSPRVFLGARWR
jgi:ATP-dependent Lhr-like helicase